MPLAMLCFRSRVLNIVEGIGYNEFYIKVTFIYINKLTGLLLHASIVVSAAWDRG